MPITTFTLKREHITLLTNSEIIYQNCETGAAGIDPKRPYGNSSVEYDVADLLEIDLHDDVNCMQYHYETATALQVILDTQGFVLGEYERIDGTWALKPECRCDGSGMVVVRCPTNMPGCCTVHKRRCPGCREE